jgi:hypothetical protein
MTVSCAVASTLLRQGLPKENTMPRTVALLALLTLAAPHRVAAYCLDKYPGQTSYAAWAAQPVKYRVSTSLTDTKILAAIDAAFKTWGPVQCSKLALSKDAPFSIAAVPFTKGTGHINVYWVTKTSELPSGMDSKYYIYHYRNFDAKGQLVGGSVAVNAMTFKWTTTGGDASSFDVQNVMTHYIGKLIGLTDSKTAGAVMYPDVNFGQTAKRTLTADDVAQEQHFVGVVEHQVAAAAVGVPYPDDLARHHVEAALLPGLAHHHLCRRLADVGPAARKGPATVAALLDHQDLALPQGGTTHVHLGRRVSRLRNEAFGQFGDALTGVAGDHLGGDLHQPAAALDVVLVLGERQTGLTQRLDLSCPRQPAGKALVVHRRMIPIGRRPWSVARGPWSVAGRMAPARRSARGWRHEVC